MPNYSILFFLLLLSNSLFSQSAKDVVDNYFEAIGGKSRWKKLQSRKSVEELTVYSKDSFTEVIDRTLNYTNYYQEPASYLRSWTENIFFFIRAYTTSCNWYYSDHTMSVSFFDKEYNVKKTSIPQIGILKILTFPMKDSVIIEDNCYRIDFEDVLWNRTMSVYFDKRTYLVTKHTYKSSGESILREYYYKNYKDKGGYVEPYIIEHYLDGAKYTITKVEQVFYDIDVNPEIFLPPIECDQKKYKPIKLDGPLRFSY